MSELNIDASLIDKGEAALKYSKEKLVPMSNGCICCTLREDLIEEITKLANSKKFDYLVIESSGISNLYPLQKLLLLLIVMVKVYQILQDLILWLR